MHNALHACKNVVDGGQVGEDRVTGQAVLVTGPGKPLLSELMTNATSPWSTTWETLIFSVAHFPDGSQI